MPSFNLLPDTQVKALVEYVKYLSLRGQTELRLIGAMSELGEDEKLANTCATLVDEIMKPLAESWSTAGESVIRPQEKPAIELAESVAKGREVFYGTKGNCAKCHGPSALGDGQTTDYDDWNKPVAELAKDLAGDRADRRRVALVALVQFGVDRHAGAYRRRAVGLEARRVAAAQRVAAQFAARHLSRWPLAARFVSPHLRRHQWHADAGRRSGVAGRRGNLKLRRNLEPGRLCAIAAV